MNVKMTGSTTQGTASAATRRRIALCSLLLLGLLIRVLYVLELPVERLTSDEYDYVESAIGLTDSCSFERTVFFHVPPVVPMMLAGAFTLSGPGYQEARLFQAVLFLFIGWVIYQLGSEVGGRIVGFLALLFCTVYPYFIYFCGNIGSETPAALVLPAMLLLAIRAVRSRRPLDSALFGIALALAGLTRSAAFYFVLAAPLVFLIGWGPRQLHWLKATAIVTAAFLLTCLPWFFVLSRSVGRPMATPTTGSGVMLYQTALRITVPDDAERMRILKEEILPKYYYRPGVTDQELLAGDKHLQQEGMRIIRQHPREYLGVVLHNLRRFWQLYPHSDSTKENARLYMIVGLLSFGALLPFALAGALLGLRQLQLLSALYGFIAYYTLVHALLYGMLRYRIPMDTIVLVFAALGLAAFLKRLVPRFEGHIVVLLGGNRGEASIEPRRRIDHEQ